MYKVENMQDFYQSVGKCLLENGHIISPRGHNTRELLGVTFMLVNPRERLVHCEGRRFNLLYALVESLLLVQNSKQLKYYSAFNENVKQFSDDGQTLYGAYGARIVKEIWYAIDKLRNDRDTRQAVISIYGGADIRKRTKDVPCTMNLHFMIRNDKLDLHTYMRSNDIVWGTQYDVFMFTMLQEVIANTLGIDLGNYYHTATSLHVYIDSFSKEAMLEQLVYGNSQNISFENPYDLIEWQLLSRWYKANVDNNGKAIRRIITEDKFLSLSDNPFMHLLSNEFCHRDEIDFLMDVPEWAMPFVAKRWGLDRHV